MDTYLCFDIGGSSLKCAAADEEGRLFHTRSYPMSADIEGLLAYMKAYKKMCIRDSDDTEGRKNDADKGRLHGTDHRLNGWTCC